MQLQESTPRTFVLCCVADPLFGCCSSHQLGEVLTIERMRFDRGGGEVYECIAPSCLSCVAVRDGLFAQQQLHGPFVSVEE